MSNPKVPTIGEIKAALSESVTEYEARRMKLYRDALDASGESELEFNVSTFHDLMSTRQFEEYTRLRYETLYEGVLDIMEKYIDNLGNPVLYELAQLVDKLISEFYSEVDDE